MSCKLTALLCVATTLSIASPGFATTGDSEPAYIAAANFDPWTDPTIGAEVDALIHQGIRHNSDGDFDAANEVWKQLGEIAPHHPAANTHAVDTLFWLQIFEDDDTSLDDAIERESEEGIRKAKRWVEERPDDARAHLYLGHTLMCLGRLNGVRLRVYKAGTLGEKAREELERALELDPTLIDAKYSIGLYAYYASLVPDLVQWLRFLWFVPTANAPLGLQYLGEVREGGDLFQFTAAFYLANIRTYHEKWLDQAAALTGLETLHEQHPRNSLVHFELIEALMLAERYPDVIRETLLLESHSGTAVHDRGRANMARIWRARAELYLGHSERAWQLLDEFGEDGPEAPSWGNRWVQVTRGQIKDARGERESAIEYYERVTALELNPTFSRSTVIAADGVREAFRPPAEISAQDPRRARGS